MKYYGSLLLKLVIKAILTTVKVAYALIKRFKKKVWELRRSKMRLPKIKMYKHGRIARQNQQAKQNSTPKFNLRSNFGRSTVDIKCPFCGDIVTAFIWSLAGSGKKCSCGALHTNYGTTHKKISS